VKLLVLSDLHFEHHRDGGQSFVRCLAPPEDVDVCILAGDIAVGQGIPGALKLFCSRYSKVIYVHGNHELYGTTRKASHHHTLQAVRKFDNLTWLSPHDGLESGSVELDGQRFLGSTLWFPQTENQYWHQMMDFHTIKGFKEWVYEENETTQQLLTSHVGADDIVITHHLPTYQSVHPMYAGNPLNDFFVCDLEPLIVVKQPKVWIHGHTHTSLDYLIGKTRVVCNPFGYARREENAKFDFGRVLEV